MFCTQWNCHLFAPIAVLLSQSPHTEGFHYKDGSPEDSSGEGPLRKKCDLLSLVIHVRVLEWCIFFCAAPGTEDIPAPFLLRSIDRRSSTGISVQCEERHICLAVHVNRAFSSCTTCSTTNFEVCACQACGHQLLCSVHCVT